MGVWTTGSLTIQLCDVAGRVIQRQAAPNHIVLSGRDLVARMFVLGDAIKPLQLDRDLLEISTEDGKDKRKKVIIHYNAALVPAELIPSGACFLSVGIDLSGQSDDIKFREVGTHDVDVPLTE